MDTKYLMSNLKSLETCLNSYAILYSPASPLYEELAHKSINHA